MQRPHTRHRPEPDPYHPSRGGQPGRVSGTLLPLKNFSVLGFEDRMLVDDRLVEPGTLLWLLREHAGLLFPDWLLDGWRGGTRRGREAWPAPLLFALLLLRHSEAGLSRVGAVRRAGTDAVWRAALRLPWAAAKRAARVIRVFFPVTGSS